MSLKGCFFWLLLVCGFVIFKMVEYNKYHDHVEVDRDSIINELLYPSKTIKKKTLTEEVNDAKLYYSLNLLMSRELSELSKLCTLRNFRNLSLTDKDMLYISREWKEEHKGDSAYMKGLAYVFDRDVPRDLDKAEYWFIKAAKYGNFNGLYFYVGLYLNDEIDSIGHAGRVIEIIKGEADIYDSAAQYLVGRMYLEGKGLEQDTELGVKYLRDSAELGFVTAQVVLGGIYYVGSDDGVIEVDYDKARKWSSLAAEQGDAGAECTLGTMYYKGEGVEQNYKEAFKLFKHSAEKGDLIAEFNLAYMYYTGEGVTQDYIVAAAKFEKLAIYGSIASNRILGDMYLNGEGVEKNLYKAIEWYKKGAELGSEAAKDRLKELLPPETGEQE